MKTGIKAKDACHVACAISASCDYFLTTDDRLLINKKCFSDMAYKKSRFHETVWKIFLLNRVGTRPHSMDFLIEKAFLTGFPTGSSGWSVSFQKAHFLAVMNKIQGFWVWQTSPYRKQQEYSYIWLYSVIPEPAFRGYIELLTACSFVAVSQPLNHSLCIYLHPFRKNEESVLLLTYA